jgi:hypothetical protein
MLRAYLAGRRELWQMLKFSLSVEPDSTIPIDQAEVKRQKAAARDTQGGANPLRSVPGR